MRAHSLLTGLLLLSGCAVTVETTPVKTLGTLPPVSVPPLPQPVATALEPAVRGTTTLVDTEPPPPPPTVPAGLHGLPFAPENLSDCDEMNFYRVQWGLPERFSQLGWRESNCRNEESVHTYCCWGYWQLYTSLHLRDHRLAPRYAACGVTTHDDYDGDTPIEKQRQACAARALFDVVGYSAWAL